MNDNIAQIEQNYSLTKSDYTEKNQLYKGLESNVLDKNDNSFTQISKKKSDFDAAYKSLLERKRGSNARPTEVNSKSLLKEKMKLNPMKKNGMNSKK